MAKSKMETPGDGDDWLVVPCERPEHVEKGVGVKEQPQMDEGEHPATENEGNQAWLLGLRSGDMRFFKVSVWPNGKDEPVEVHPDKSLLIAVDKYCSMETLQQLLQDAVVTLPELQQLFPEVTSDTVADAIQVCVLSDDKTSWEPVAKRESRFQENTRQQDEDNEDAAEYMVGTIDVPDDAEIGDLLVETRFVASSGDGLVDWRLGRFYTDIKKNVWRFQLQIGQLIDALDTDKRWYESRVVDVGPSHVKVHYRGWTAKWDEWLHRMSSRLAPLHKYVRNWRDFEVGDEVMVGTEIPGKRYPEWRNACVTAREATGKDGSFQLIELDVDGSKYWMDTQDELLCPLGTHKAVNATKKEAASVLTVPPSLLQDYFDLPEEPVGSLPNEVESASEMMQNMQFAEGDDWCVVDDEFEGDDIEPVSKKTNQEDNQGDNDNPNDQTLQNQSSSECSQSATSLDCNADCSSSGESTDCTIGAMSATAEKVSSAVNLPDQDSEDEESWRFELEIGQLVDALDTDNNWYESRVVAVSSTFVKVHYRGWTSKWDEWLERTSSRIAPLHSKVPDWRMFKVYDEVLVGRKVNTKKYPEWRNAVVTACENCEVDGSLRIEVDIDGVRVWMDAQDELLCLPGTHKALNAPVLTRSSSLF